MTMAEVAYLLEFTREPEDKYAGNLTQGDVEELQAWMETFDK
jgi:hypothetical protein